MHPRPRQPRSQSCRYPCPAERENDLSFPDPLDKGNAGTGNEVEAAKVHSRPQNSRNGRNKPSTSGNENNSREPPFLLPTVWIVNKPASEKMREKWVTIRQKNYQSQNLVMHNDQEWVQLTYCNVWCLGETEIKDFPSKTIFSLKNTHACFACFPFRVKKCISGQQTPSSWKLKKIALSNKNNNIIFFSKYSYLEKNS